MLNLHCIVGREVLTDQFRNSQIACERKYNIYYVLHDSYHKKYLYICFQDCCFQIYPSILTLKQIISIENCD